MSPREWRFLIDDIVEAIGKIQSYTDGMTPEQFAVDQRTLDAVVRNFIVIGEASGQTPAEIRHANSDVPWRLMSDMRNFAVHRYWGGGCPRAVAHDQGRPSALGLSTAAAP